MTAVLSLLLGVLVVLAITALTGWFVAQEFAYLAVDRSRLAARAASGDAAAARALAVTRRTSFMLSGAQLGITVTGLVVGYVAEPLIGESVSELLGGVDVPSGIGLAVGAVVALGFSTVVQMVLGELFPKNLAIARPEPVALRLGRSTTLYLRTFGWLVHVFDRASTALLRVLGIAQVHDVEHSASARDLEHIVAESRESGDLSPELSLLLDRVLDFPTRNAGHAMVPRVHADVVGAGDRVAEVRALMAVGHSRYPVLDADGVTVTGVVELHDVLASPPGDQRPVTVLARPPVVVPESMALPAVVRALVDTRRELACVIDEYGSFVGIITLEDLAEELVGELADEHDVGEPPAHEALPDGSWVVAGDLPVDEFERLLDRDLPEGDYETLSGLVIAHHGALPQPGEHVLVGLPLDAAQLAGDGEPLRHVADVEVLTVERHVPATVRVSIREAVEPAPLQPEEQP